MVSLKSRIFGDKKIHKRHCHYCGKESDALYCSEDCMNKDRIPDEKGD